MGESLCKALLIYLPSKVSQEKLNDIVECVERVLNEKHSKYVDRIIEYRQTVEIKNEEVEGLEAIKGIDVQNASKNVKEEEMNTELSDDQDISSSESEQERNKIMMMKRMRMRKKKSKNKKRLPKIKMKNIDIPKSKIDLQSTKVNQIQNRFIRTKIPRMHAVSECRKNFKPSTDYLQHNITTDNPKKVATSSIKQFGSHNNESPLVKKADEGYVSIQEQAGGLRYVSKTEFSLRGFKIKKYLAMKHSSLGKYEAKHIYDYSSNNSLLNGCKALSGAKLKLSESPEIQSNADKSSLNNVQSKPSRQKKLRELKTSAGQELESLYSNESIIKKLRFARKFMNPRTEFKAIKVAFTDHKLRKLVPINVLKK